MLKNKYVLIATLLLSATIYSCKKDSTKLPQEDGAVAIMKINNDISANRVDVANQGLILNFETATSQPGTGVLNNSKTADLPFELIFKGKIEPQLDDEKNALSALEVTNYGGLFMIAYQTPGSKFGGGVDMIDMQSNGPKLVSSISTPDADITCINNGGDRVFLGMDLKTFEKYDYAAPAVVGVVSVKGATFYDPQAVGLEGYSTKDLKFNKENGKLYAATSTNGGISVISFDGGKAVKTAYQPYGGARSIAISKKEVIATNGYSYSSFDLDNAAQTFYKHWPIESDKINIGNMTTLEDGNFLFGNNYALIYVDKESGKLIDQVDVGGWVNSISMFKKFIFISFCVISVLRFITKNKKITKTITAAKIVVVELSIISSTCASGNTK